MATAVRRRPIRPAVPLGVLALVAALVGCSSGGSSGGSSARSSPASGPPAAMAAERVRTDGSGNQVAFAPVTLRRSGKLVVLEVAARNVTPAGTGENKVNVPSMLIGLEARFVDVTLVDPVHAKRYLVVQDSKESCLCTSFAGGLEVARGGTAVLTAYFPAPPADVQRLDVTVNKVGTFPAVPLT